MKGWYNESSDTAASSVERYSVGRYDESTGAAVGLAVGSVVEGLFGAARI